MFVVVVSQRVNMSVAHSQDSTSRFDLSGATLRPEADAGGKRRRLEPVSHVSSTDVDAPWLAFRLRRCWHLLHLLQYFLGPPPWPLHPNAQSALLICGNCSHDWDFGGLGSGMLEPSRTGFLETSSSKVPGRPSLRILSPEGPRGPSARQSFGD